MELHNQILVFFDHLTIFWFSDRNFCTSYWQISYLKKEAHLSAELLFRKNFIDNFIVIISSVTLIDDYVKQLLLLPITTKALMIDLRQECSLYILLKSAVKAV